MSRRTQALVGSALAARRCAGVGWPRPRPPTVSQDGAASPSCTSSAWPVCVTAETLRFRNTVSRGFQGTASHWPIAMIRLIKRKNTSGVIRRRAPAWSAGHTRVLHPQVHLPARPQSPANGRQAGGALAASIPAHKAPVSPSALAGAQPTAGRAASRGGSGRLPRAPRTEVPRGCASVTVTQPRAFSVRPDPVYLPRGGSAGSLASSLSLWLVQAGRVGAEPVLPEETPDHRGHVSALASATSAPGPDDLAPPVLRPFGDSGEVSHVGPPGPLTAEAAFPGSRGRPHGRGRRA